MTTNGTAVSVEKPQAVSYKDAHGDDSHLQIILEQKSYDRLQDVIAKAETKGQTTNFEYWLESIIELGCTTKLRNWKLQEDSRDGRDLIKLMERAKNGDHQAINRLKKMFPNFAL